jgi:hypothetical protein
VRNKFHRGNDLEPAVAASTETDNLGALDVVTERSRRTSEILLDKLFLE